MTSWYLACATKACAELVRLCYIEDFVQVAETPSTSTLLSSAQLLFSMACSQSCNLQAGALLRHSKVARGLLLTVVLLATSMIIGDGVLTPAISVISAIQGLTNASSNINNSARHCIPPLFPSVSTLQ